MTIRFIVNFVFLALPIGVTLGILMGLQAARSSSGQGNLFKPDPNNNSGTGGGSTKKKGKGITHEFTCNKTIGIAAPTEDQHFTLNPNQWGWDEGDDGGLCMNVTLFNNETYSTKTTAPQWSITWQYPQGPETAPVHAFSNIMLDNIFPEKLSTIKEINLVHEWTYGVGDTASTDTDITDLTAINLNANVALDMFMDTDDSIAGNSEKASHEVMVWFSAIGPATQPLGLTIDGVTQDPLMNLTVGNSKFMLYSDKNEKGQQVLTWMADGTFDSFDGDIWPLVDKLITTDNDTFPTSSYYLGYMAWGSEAYSSDSNVTFNVPKLSIDVETS